MKRFAVFFLFATLLGCSAADGTYDHTENLVFHVKIVNGKAVDIGILFRLENFEGSLGHGNSRFAYLFDVKSDSIYSVDATDTLSIPVKYTWETRYGISAKNEEFGTLKIEYSWVDSVAGNDTLEIAPNLDGKYGIEEDWFDSTENRLVFGVYKDHNYGGSVKIDTILIIN